MDTMKYFTNCKTIEEVKKEFRNLAIKLHPDNGGSEEAFKEMMSDYSKAFEACKHTHTAKDGTTYHKTSTETPEEFAEVINKVVTMPGVKIEIVGSWIWLSGNTYNYKDEIKSIGFMWSSKHKMWFYNGEDKKLRRHTKETYSELKARLGYQEVKNQAMAFIA